MGIVLGGLTLAACGPAPRALPLGAPISPEQYDGIPAGTVLTVRMASGLGTDTSHTGQRFDAVNLVPIQSANGTLRIRGGARLTGHVTQVDADLPRLGLAFDSIETSSGPAAVHATLAPNQEEPELRSSSFRGPGPGYDVLIQFPPGVSERASVADTNATGAPADESTPAGAPPTPRQYAIRLPAGADVRLLITDTLFASTR